MSTSDRTAPSPTPEALFGLWVTEDQTRAMRITRDGEGVTRVTVWRLRDQHAHLSDRPAKWHAPIASAATSSNAKERLGYLQAEVGDPGLGSTYDLMPATRNTDPAAFGGFDWKPIPEDVSREDVRLFPQGGASYMEAVLGYWDDVVEEIRDGDRWMQPLSTWLPARDP